MYQNKSHLQRDATQRGQNKELLHWEKAKKDQGGPSETSTRTRELHLVSTEKDMTRPRSINMKSIEPARKLTR